MTSVQSIPNPTLTVKGKKALLKRKLFDFSDAARELCDVFARAIHKHGIRIYGSGYEEPFREHRHRRPLDLTPEVVAVGKAKQVVESSVVSSEVVNDNISFT